MAAMTDALPTAYAQILELLATARAVAMASGLTDVGNGIADTISDTRWHAENDHEASHYGLQQRHEWAREAAE